MKGNYLKHKEDVLIDTARLYFKKGYGWASIIINIFANFQAVVLGSISTGFLDLGLMEKSLAQFALYFVVIGLFFLIYTFISTIFFNFNRLEEMHESCKSPKIKKLEK